MPGGSSQAEDRHVAVDRLVLSCLDKVGLVPEAHTAIRANGLIIAPPGSQVWLLPISGKRFEIVEGTPVLDESDASPVEEYLPSQKPFLRMLDQRAQHRHHCAGRRTPF